MHPQSSKKVKWENVERINSPKCLGKAKLYQEWFDYYCRNFYIFKNIPQDSHHSNTGFYFNTDFIFAFKELKPKI